MQREVSFADAKKTRYPAQVVVAIARDENGKANPITLGWTTLVSNSPAMMAIAVAPKRYSVGAIRHSKCFTVAYPCEGMVDEVLLFGTKSGRDIDKLEAAGSKYCAAEEIDSALLSDAVANFECVLENEVVTGDHIVFIGRVVASHINTNPCERLYATAAGNTLGSIRSVVSD